MTTQKPVWYNVEEPQAVPGAVEALELNWSVAVIAVPTRTLVEGELASVQLSRSWHLGEQSWLRRLFQRKPPEQHWIHLEVRSKDGLRLRMSALSESEDAEGLPVMPRRGAHVSFDALRDVFLTARVLGASLASWDADLTQLGEPLSRPPEEDTLVVEALRVAPPERQTTPEPQPVKREPVLHPAKAEHRLDDLEHTRIGTTRLRHGGEVNAVTCSPDGTYIVSAGEDWSARIWDLKSGEMLDHVTVDSNSTSYSVAFSPLGDIWASCGTSTQVHLRTVGKAESIATLDGLTNGMDGLTFSPDGKRLAVINKHAILMWALPDGSTGFELPNPKPVVVYKTDATLDSLMFMPDGEHLVVGVRSVGALVVEAKGSGKVVRELKHENLPGYVRVRVAVSADSSKVAVASEGLWLWTWRSGEMRQLSTSRTYTAVFTPDTDELIVGGSYLGLHAFPTRDGDKREPRRLIPKGEPDAYRVAINLDGRWLVWSNGCYIIQRYDRQKEERLSLDNALVQSLTRMRFSPKGKALVGAASYSTLYLWSHPEYTLSQEDPRDAISLNTLEFTPDGRFLLSASWNQLRWYRWKAFNGELELHHTFNPGRYLLTAAISPDGQRVVIGLSSGAMGIYHVKSDGTLEEQVTHEKGTLPSEGFCKLSWGPGCLAALDAKRVQVHDTTSGRVLWAKFIDLGPQTHAVSHDGQYIAVGCHAGHVLIFRASNGAEVAHIKRKGAYHRISGMRWSHDGRWLIVESNPHARISLWRFEDEQFSLEHVIRFQLESPRCTDFDPNDSNTVAVALSACSNVILTIPPRVVENAEDGEPPPPSE